MQRKVVASTTVATATVTLYCSCHHGRGTFLCRASIHFLKQLAGTLSWLALLLNARKLLTETSAAAAHCFCLCLYYIFSIFRIEQQTYCKSANGEHKMRWKSFISEIICPGTTTTRARRRRRRMDAPKWQKRKIRKKKERKITAERHRETKRKRRRDEAEKGRRHTKATGQNTGKAAPKLLQAKCVGKFLTARGYNNVAKSVFPFAVQRNLRQHREVCYTFL